MPRNTSNQTNYNNFAVSAAAETALNTPQQLELSLLLAKGDIWQPQPRTETNENEANGLSGPDIIYRRGQTGKMGWTLDMLQPHQAALLLAYGLGKCVSTDLGSFGFLHEITERTADMEMGVRSLPTFTAAQAVGETVDLQRISSMAINSGSLTFARDQWVKGKAELVSTGKVDSGYSTATVTALDNATSLNLSTAVQGADAQERLSNVQKIMAYYNYAWRKIDATAVSGASPAVVTIPSLGGAGASIPYQVTYSPPYPNWGGMVTFPAQLAGESALQVSNACIWVGGEWDGSDFAGGFPLAAQLDSLEWSFNNNVKPEFTACAGGDYAGRMLKERLSQQLKVSADMYDILMEEWRKNGRYFGAWVLCEGAEFAPGHKYTLELIWPRLGILSNDVKDKSGRLSIDSNIAVLCDPEYGQIIARVKHKWYLPALGAA